MSAEDYKIDGVVYKPIHTSGNTCEGCAGNHNAAVCIELGEICSDKIWVIKEEDKLQDYIQKIEEKYPEEEQEQKKHKHYFKDVSNLKYIDIYRTIQIFEVTDPCIQHAVKKLLVTGNRGFKSVENDIQDVIDTLERWKEMQEEDNKEKL